MNQETSIVPAGKIPIGRTLVMAYTTLGKNLWPFAQIALFPLALGVLLSYGWTEIYPPLYSSLVGLLGYQPMVWISVLTQQWFIDWAIAWLMPLLVMSHWLQFLSTRQAGGKPAIVRIFSSRDLRVLRYGLLLLIMPAVTALVRQFWGLSSAGLLGTDILALPLDNLQSALAFLEPASIVIDALVVARSAPVFAAAAAGEAMTLRQAWQMTQGQTSRLMLLWLVLFWMTYALAAPLQWAVVDLYATLVLSFYPSGEYIRSYDHPLFTPLITLPIAALHCAAMALGACLFWRVYRGDAEARDKLLERFE